MLGLSSSAGPHRACSCDCGFSLWHPSVERGSCHVGLYDDARFPGRLIVSLVEHFDAFEDVPTEIATRFMTEVQGLCRDLKSCLHVDRINIALLGNQESHVHAHLVPRRRGTDPLPAKAPWEDPRPRAKLDPHELARLKEQLSLALGVDVTTR